MPVEEAVDSLYLEKSRSSHLREIVQNVLS